MSTCRPAPVPEIALLARYSPPAAYTDGFTLDLGRRVSFDAFVAAFYTTPLFKLERGVLRLLGYPATDGEALALGRGETDRFAAWTVEARAEQQLLLRDATGRTRSWLMTSSGADADRTSLYFGSAIVPRANNAGEPRELGRLFRLTLGPHGRYSVALLNAAGRRLLAD